MEFIKMGNKYLVKDSNGLIVDEKEKEKLEKNEMVIKDITSNDCQKETIKKSKKRQVKEIEDTKEETQEPIDLDATI